MGLATIVRDLPFVLLLLMAMMTSITLITDDDVGGRWTYHVLCLPLLLVRPERGSFHIAFISCSDTNYLLYPT